MHYRKQNFPMEPTSQYEGISTEHQVFLLYAKLMEFSMVNKSMVSKSSPTVITPQNYLCGDLKFQSQKGVVSVIREQTRIDNFW